MQQTSREFLHNARAAMAEPERAQTRDLLGRFSPLLREQAVAEFGDFDTLRERVRQMRQHTLAHLDHYLEQFVENAERRGNRVHFARDAAELNQKVSDICAQHGATRVIKGKSMVTEETALNAHLAAGGIEVLETDLGEYIVQQAGETPSHIVGPALHKPVAEIRELFLERHALGERELETPAAMVAEARAVLRQRFLDAQVGIIGANALIADTGYSLLVTNEGNGDLCANLPPVLIICTTLERIVPDTADAMATVRLLVRSTTGQPITCYTSLYSGPRHEDETQGPVETHIVLLDNRRTDLLASDYREMLQCIRCGACLNHCPIYISTGGHAYGWVYPGPMGSVLTPLLTSLEESQQLPNACTACGRCAEVCPADIPLPDLLRDLRTEEFSRGLLAPRWRRGLALHNWVALRPRLYHWLGSAAVRVLHRFTRARGRARRLPLAGGWSSARDFPAPQADTFMRQWQRGRRQ